jgi:hypothetical protein
MDEQVEGLIARNDERVDAGAELAVLLGVEPEQIVQVLGAGWRRETALPDFSTEQWFVSGVPPQVAVGFDGFVFVLARPAPRWSGVAHLEWHFDGDHRFAAEDLLHDSEALAQTAEEIARGRRRSFRWCRTCREVTAPEWFLRGEGICMGCASATTAWFSDDA